ncbi:hypothetical protein M406DRAFT_72331 [Cryphonectria parasitica EP155]|uniref:Restriction of telomere capping protein 4 n=1 Tax=Cryphonectria parasitica (strain ATCC 38755 / EP155) TaxID=660469 RepID=A0A9P5CKJ6_CRYP1|nr:uncharacterized protein M406DRAFT_72331 [Cryphonectria parasitica EP155]KAF3762319.1 hypothetical protein M406DRAFT_72331 [Cryphonectria parasitica EP155]
MPPLSRHDVPPLHKMINGKPRPGIPKPIPEPADVTALPIESSDEEEVKEPPGYPPDNRYIDSSDDDDDLFGSADIQPTNFGEKTGPTNQTASNLTGYARNEKLSTGTRGQSGIRRSARQVETPHLKKRPMHAVEDDGADESAADASNKKARRNAHKSSSGIGDHMVDGWMVGKRKNEAAYGSKRGRGSQNSTPVRTFKTRKAPDTPEKKNVFKKPAAVSYDSTPSPDSKSSQLSSPAAHTPKPLEVRTKKQISSRRQRARGKKSRNVIQDDVSRRPEFRMPTSYDEYAPNPEPADFDTPLDDTPDETDTALEKGQTLCPICEEVVDEGLLKAFSRGERMDVIRQARFCRLHKKKAAQKQWKEKGYPEIDWKGLKQRIKSHRDHIKSLIEGKASDSYFGSLLRENIKMGKNRTLLRTEEFLSPGYYGLRGMSLMTETIVEMFSSLLRKRAPQDKLISARGYTGFVQSVLVPELAVRLIQEDMSLSLQEAQDVMLESRVVGDTLCDDKEDSQTYSPVQQQQAEEEEVNSGDDDDGDGDGCAGESQEGKVEETPDEVSTQLKIQEVLDSDDESDLSSIASMGDEVDIKNNVDTTTQLQKTADSDSDLTSLDELC